MPTEDEAGVTILDYIDKMEVPGHPFQNPTNEYWALICLRDGMEHLYKQTLQVDEFVRSRLGIDANYRCFIMGNDPALNAIPKSLLTSYFHWYAISACQYVRTVGAIAFQLDSNRPKPKAYAQAVIPEVVAFRDKVAAHFAWTTKNSHDNDAEQHASILPPLSFINDSFYVGSMVLKISRGTKVSDSNSIQPWSLCKVHERLRARYWPELLTESHSVDKVELSSALRKAIELI